MLQKATHIYDQEEHYVDLNSIGTESHLNKVGQTECTT